MGGPYPTGAATGFGLAFGAGSSGAAYPGLDPAQIAYMNLLVMPGAMSYMGGSHWSCHTACGTLQK